MKLSSKAVNQIARIVYQAILPDTNTDYNSELFENWKFGHQYFNAAAVLDGNIRMSVERRLKMNIAEIKLESEDAVFTFSIVTNGSALAFFIEGCKNYLAQEKAPKSIDDVVGIFKLLFGSDAAVQVKQFPEATRIECQNWEQIVERFSAFPPVDVGINYEIDGSARVPAAWRTRDSV